MSVSIEDLSEGLASCVARAEASVVGVGAESGLSWTSELVVTSASGLRRCGQPRDAIDVRLAGGETWTARVLGEDPASDLAVLRVDGGGLKAIAQRAASRVVRVGEVVTALARPGRAIRASQRIVGLVSDNVPSRRGLVLPRYVEMDRGFPDGFVGGAIVDARGELVGVGTDRVIRGADLALPPAFLSPLVDAIAADGRPRLGWLGVSVQGVALPERLLSEVPHGRGALVTGVEKDGPAERAGVGLGDVIVRIDATPIDGAEALLASLRALAGRDVELVIVRASSVTRLPATIGARQH